MTKMLHLINSGTDYAVLMQRIQPESALVFADAAVLALHNNGALAVLISQWLTECSGYALLPDMQLRGVQTEELVAGIQVIDYQQLVALTTRYEVIKTWR